MAAHETAFEKAYALGVTTGQRSALDRWLSKDAPATVEARLASLAVEADRLALGMRTYPAGISIDIEAPREVRPTRAGVMDALRYGVFISRENDEERAAATFVQERLLPVVRDGEWFDFGEVAYTDLGASDWRPFAESGLINLPFPRVSFRVRLDTGRVIDGAERKLEIVWFAEQDSESLSILGLFVLGKDRALGLSGFHRYDRAILQAHKLTFRDHIDHIFFALWLVLHTKGVPQERIDPPPKLNKARAKAGKTLLQPYVKVDTVTYINALRETERLEAGGGHHASPRPHLRRAHLRHLASGVVVPVMATIVNGSPDLKLIQREKYVVKATPPRGPQ
jgi:hypothetical protein